MTKIFNWKLSMDKTFLIYTGLSFIILLFVCPTIAISSDESEIEQTQTNIKDKNTSNEELRMWLDSDGNLHFRLEKPDKNGNFSDSSYPVYPKDQTLKVTINDKPMKKKSNSTENYSKMNSLKAHSHSFYYDNTSHNYTTLINSSQNYFLIPI
jgi:hypothetical protein